MLFSRMTFLLIFLPLVLGIYYASPKYMKNTILLCGSFLFFAWGEPLYIFVMLFFIGLAYFQGLFLRKFIKLGQEKKAKRTLIIGIIGIAVYYASSIGFEMLTLSKQYYQTDSVEFKQQLISVGHGLILKYKGTAFDVYYVFNAIALLLIAKTMFNSKEFGKAAATWGLIAGLFMIIPSTAGTIGLIFSLISLIPWIVFSIIVGRKMLIIAKK